VLEPMQVSAVRASEVQVSKVHQPPLILVGTVK
jgi:hypothetical protein